MPDAGLVGLIAAAGACTQVESLREHTVYGRTRHSQTEEAPKASRQENVRAGGKTNTGRF